MKVEAPFIHLIKLHTKYYLYDVNSKMIVNISNDIVNIGLHFILKNVRPYAASCSEA